MTVKRVSYLVHRWLGLALSVLVLEWFVSGIVLMYYPWPGLTDSGALAVLTPFQPSSQLIGFGAARAAADAAHNASTVGAESRTDTLVGGRLMRWGDRLVYQLWRPREGAVEPAALVDAFSGRVLGPVSQRDAVVAARDVVGPLPPLENVASLSEGDHYTMAGALETSFPAFRVQFADPSRSAVYVSRASGATFGVVTRLTRVTTWFGTVPHYLYFQWLYRRRQLWTTARIGPAAIAVLMAIAGIVFGVYGLFPRRRRGDWRPSAYTGVSLWHHLTGIVFGALVLTWCLSGLLEELGVSNKARVGQAERARGGAIGWSHVRVSEADGAQTAATFLAGSAQLLAIDLYQIEGHPGYLFHFSRANQVWVDAGDGTVRGELSESDARRIAQGVAGSPAGAEHCDRLTGYDTYYYAHHGYERTLPVWRVAFGDRAHSVVYLDTMTGAPVGFVDDRVRTWRWVRDAMHTVDVGALNDRRPLRDAVLLPLLLGGTISAVTGVWLLGRRLNRMVAPKA